MALYFTVWSRGPIKSARLQQSEEKVSSWEPFHVEVKKKKVVTDVWSYSKKPPPHPLRFLPEMKEIEWKCSRRRHESTAEAQQASGRLNLAPWGNSQHLWEDKKSCNRKLLTWDLWLMFDTQSWAQRRFLFTPESIPMNNWSTRRANDPCDDSIMSGMAWPWDLLSGASCSFCPN